MIARRLIVAGLTVGFVTPEPPPDPEPPLPTASPLTSAPNGGNSPWTITAALYHATPDKTFITYVDRSGNIEGIEYDHDASSIAGPFTIHSAFQADAHDSPSIVRRASDGKFIIVYSKHNSTPINLRVSTDADSLNGWGAATNLDSQLGGSRYTDQQLYEYEDTLYLFVRDEPTAGTDSRWRLSTNDSATPTAGWSALSTLFREPSARSYVITYMDHARGKLHFISTNRGLTSGGISGFSKLGHWYFDLEAGTHHKSDGTAMGAPPFDFADLTEIYAGTEDVFPSNLTVDEDGLVVVAGRDTIAADDRYLYIREQADHSWHSTNVASGMDGYIYGGAGTPQAYGWCIDPIDANLMWLIADDGEQPEVYLYETDDGGESFTSTQVTDGSTQLQVQIIPVISAHPDLRVFWHRGTWTSYTNWNTGLVGAGFGP